jgi:hypothetical protein
VQPLLEPLEMEVARPRSGKGSLVLKHVNALPEDLIRRIARVIVELRARA